MTDLSESQVLKNTIYQLSEPANVLEVLSPRSTETSKTLILYHENIVAQARTEDMYLDRLMCE